MRSPRSIALFLIAIILSPTAREVVGESKGRAAWTTSRLKGAPEPPAPYRVRPAFPKLRFDLPTCIEPVPGSNRLLITERTGKVFTFPAEAGVAQADIVVDLAKLVSGKAKGKPVSLFDAEFHPQFHKNRSLFVCYVHPGDGRHTRVSRFTLTDDEAPRVKRGSEEVIITWKAGGHNAGCLEFGKDGFLYISTGDGSGPNPPDGLTTGQTVSDLLGAVLRIDVDRKEKDRAYVIPSDNPFTQAENARGEVWAYGLRNPWKFGVDPKTGKIFAADNGWESWEMVHRIVRGGNCGWPVREGRAALRTEVAVGPTPILPPVKDHPHTEANSVIGGPVYRGEKLKALQGAFIYGDYITGTIWAIHTDGDSYEHETLVDTDQRIVSFTQGPHGELYVLDFDFTGQVYELLPSNVPDTSAEFPRRLSDTGLFSSVKDLKPAAGVVPYAVTVPRWMDGAAARRWIAIPGQGHATLSASPTEAGRYPEGTVLVKHLEWPPVNGSAPLRLETQVLLHQRGSWSPYSYLWNEDGSDAELVSSIGADRAVKVATSEGLSERTWHVSAVNECKLCHNPGSHFVLGFAANQLSTSHDGESQLDALVDLGVIAKAEKVPAAAKLVNPHDAAQALNDRARSYLHANCASCHHPGGNAIVSFYLRRDLPFDKLNTNKGTGIGTFGLQDAKLIVPGDPYRSVLMYRMTKLGYARMPYIGSRVVDSRGVALIDEWIRSLDAAGPSASAPLKQGSAEFKALSSLKNDRDVTTLMQSSGGALALAIRMHQGTVPAAARQTVLKQTRSARSDIAGLLETFLPESERRARLGPNIQPQTILTLAGDAARGKLIFFSDSARCRNCHHTDDAKKSLGPTLTDVRKKYLRKSELLQHVLQPSLKIEDKFAGYSVLTNGGRVETGMLVAQTPGQVVLRTTEKKSIRVPRSDIATIKKNKKSLMPDRLLSDLTAQEAADLLEFLAAQPR